MPYGAHVSIAASIRGTITANAAEPIGEGRVAQYSIPEMTQLHQVVIPGAAGTKPEYPGRFTAFRERTGRQAFPPVIALRLSVAQKPCNQGFYSSVIGPGVS